MKVQTSAPPYGVIDATEGGCVPWNYLGVLLLQMAAVGYWEEYVSERHIQDALFPDAREVAEEQADLIGYRGPVACNAAGITYRQLDYWARTGLVAPTIRTASGSGSQRLYSFKDILVLKVVKRLLDTGVSLQNVRTAVDHLRERGVNDLANITLLSDGTTVYECTSAEEVVDLLQGGQGVFGIAVSGAMRELTGAIADFPGERADGGESISAPEDELASRRKTRDRKIG